MKLLVALTIDERALIASLEDPPEGSPSFAQCPECSRQEFGPWSRKVEGS